MAAKTSWHRCGTTLRHCRPYFTVTLRILSTSSQRIVTKGRIVEWAPPNCPLPRGVRTLRLIHGFCPPESTTQTTSRSVQPFSYFGGGMFRRQSSHRAAGYALVPVRKFSRNKDLRQFVDQKIPADLRPSADGSAVRTKSGFKAAKAARAPSLSPTEGLPQNRSYFTSRLTDAYETTT